MGLGFFTPSGHFFCGFVGEHFFLFITPLGKCRMGGGGWWLGEGWGASLEKLWEVCTFMQQFWAWSEMRFTVQVEQFDTFYTFFWTNGASWECSAGSASWFSTQLICWTETCPFTPHATKPTVHTLTLKWRIQCTSLIHGRSWTTKGFETNLKSVPEHMGLSCYIHMHMSPMF